MQEIHLNIEQNTFYEDYYKQEEEAIKKDILQMIKHWSFVFDEPIENTLTTPSINRIVLSNDLIKEEYKEFTDEVFEDVAQLDPKKEINLNNVADHLGDLLWVVVRAMYTFGINPTTVIRKIYESNMSKICKTEQEAELTVECYADGTHPDKMGEIIDTYYEPFNNYFLVKRASDSKVLKSINFIKPDFSDLP